METGVTLPDFLYGEQTKYYIFPPQEQRNDIDNILRLLVSLNLTNAGSFIYYLNFTFTIFYINNIILFLNFGKPPHKSHM